MGEIIWLASYPKSGNTWTRAFLTKYLAHEDDALDINHLARSTISSSRPLFDHSIGIEAATLTPDEIDRLRPAVFRHFAQELPRTFFMKTHEAWRTTIDNEPLFPHAATRSAIYIVRNPLDVAVSSAYHFGRTIDDSIAALNDPSHTIANRLHTVGEQLPQWLGTWSQHAQSWLDQRHYPCHFMRYEDMLANPIAAFRKLVDFAGIDYDKTRLQAAVRATSFAELRRQERDQGFKERPPANTELFFRAGRSGSWREQLSPDQCAAIIDHHGPMMQRLGYLDHNGHPLTENEHGTTT